MVRKTAIIYEPSLAVYFQETLNHYSTDYQPLPGEDTIWYLSDMLARFAHSDAVFSYEEGSLTIRPLAMLYSDATQAKSKRHRHLLLRQLGDLALFLGALCPELFSKKGIGKDYLVGMGGGAYAYLSNNSLQHHHIFNELAESFTRILELVSKACAKQNHFDASDVLGLYQRWKSSKNPLIKKQLEAVGIMPQDIDNLQ